MNDKALKISGTVLGLFGILSLFISTSVIFDLFGMRQREGNTVFFIIYVNFLSSFAYLFCSYGFFTKNKLTTKVLFITLAILLASYVGLICYIQVGNVIELVLIKVMLIRVSLTIIFAGISWYYITRVRLILP
jgi:hypothetical protein